MEETVGARKSERINQGLDEELKKFATRPLDEEYPCLILDARYEKVREDGMIRSQAVMIAIGINWDGRRSILAVELGSELKKQERGLKPATTCMTKCYRAHVVADFSPRF